MVAIDKTEQALKLFKDEILITKIKNLGLA